MRIEVRPQSVAIGAAATFLDLRKHAVIAAELPLLAKAASWIGSIANQSRATLGGNLVNGSPAADSSPALLAYDAEIEMISVRGRRRIPYCEFHTGYKRNVLAADELLYAIHLPRRFARHRQYLRKVGTRRAMAIAKVALGATALVEDKRNSTRFAWERQAWRRFPRGFRRPRRRCWARRSRARQCWPRGTRSARRSAADRRHPLHGRVPAARGRESARGVFARTATRGRETMNATLAAWNAGGRSRGPRSHDGLLRLEALGGSHGRAAPHRERAGAERGGGPRVESRCRKPDWLEAFACHPRIGERKARRTQSGQSAAVVASRSSRRQARPSERVLAELAEGNELYEERFGFTYIVCATGKSAEEMLAILKRRLAATREAELREAAEQQRQIMQIRLGKWLIE